MLCVYSNNLHDISVNHGDLEYSIDAADIVKLAGFRSYVLC